MRDHVSNHDHFNKKLLKPISGIEILFWKYFTAKKVLHFAHTPEVFPISTPPNFFTYDSVQGSIIAKFDLILRLYYLISNLNIALLILIYRNVPFHFSVNQYSNMHRVHHQEHPE